MAKQQQQKPKAVVILVLLFSSPFLFKTTSLESTLNYYFDHYLQNGRSSFFLGSLSFSLLQEDVTSPFLQENIL